MFTLTSRAIHLLRRISEGMTNKEIAVDMFTTEQVVKNRITILMNVLAMKNRTRYELATYYIKNRAQLEKKEL